MSASSLATAAANALIAYAGAAAPIRTLAPNSPEFAAQVTAVTDARPATVQAIADFKSAAQLLGPVTVVWSGVTQTAVELASRAYAMASDTMACTLDDDEAGTLATAFASVVPAYQAMGQ